MLYGTFGRVQLSVIYIVILAQALAWKYTSISFFDADLYFPLKSDSQSQFLTLKHTCNVHCHFVKPITPYSSFLEFATLLQNHLYRVFFLGQGRLVNIQSQKRGNLPHLASYSPFTLALIGCMSFLSL